MTREKARRLDLATIIIANRSVHLLVQYQDVIVVMVVGGIVTITLAVFVAARWLTQVLVGSCYLVRLLLHSSVQ